MSVGPPRVIHSHLKALYLSCTAFSILADLLRCAAAALRQHIAEALAFGNLFYHCQNIIRISPSQLATIEVLRCNNAFFKALHGEGNGAATTDSIDAISIGRLAHLEYRGQVVNLE